MHRSIAVAALLLTSCAPKADVERETEGTSTTGDAEVTSESTGPQWPEVCASHATEAACSAVVGQYGCEWVEIFTLQLGADSCETTVLRSECVAFEIHGNGCSTGLLCGEEYVFGPWYREGAAGLEYTQDLCEQVPPSWTHCDGSDDDPPECECACLDAD